MTAPARTAAWADPAVAGDSGSLPRRLAAPAATAVAAAAAATAIYLGDPTTAGGLLPVCPTHALLGIDCPGCGGMRMVYSVMHGDLSGALRYNALALLACALLAITYLGWTLGRIRNQPPPGLALWARMRWAPLAVGACVGVWFVIRNIPVAPFTGLAL